jgi:hypothetical protein
MMLLGFAGLIIVGYRYPFQTAPLELGVLDLQPIPAAARRVGAA